MATPKIQPTSIFNVLTDLLSKEKVDALGLTHQGESNKTLTYGPNPNELGLQVPFNQGTAMYDSYLLQEISSDIILMYGSFYSQLYRKTQTRNRSLSVPRSVKDMLLKENFPVHKVRIR